MYFNKHDINLKEAIRERKRGRKISLNFDYQICFDRRIKEEISLLNELKIQSIILIANVKKTNFPYLTDLTDNLGNSLLFVSRNDNFLSKYFSLFSKPIAYYLQAIYLVFKLNPHFIVLHDLPAYQILSKTLFLLRLIIPNYKFQIFYDAHELYASQPQIDPIWIPIEKKAIIKSDKVIYVSEQQIKTYSKYLRNFNKFKNKFVMLDNGINYCRLDPFKKLFENKLDKHFKDNSFLLSDNQLPYSYQGNKRFFKQKDKSLEIFENHKLKYKEKLTESLRIIQDEKNKKETIKLIYAGNTNVVRNIHNIIWAVDNSNLFFANNNSDQHRFLLSIFTSEVSGSFLEIVNNLAFPERIIFRELKPQNSLLREFINSDIGIIPYLPYDLNTIYCKPNKMYEYIFAELPFIYDERLIGIKKEIGFLDGSFSFPTNMESHEFISKTLIDIITNKIYQRSQSYIEEHYSTFDLKNRCFDYKNIFV